MSKLLSNTKEFYYKEVVDLVKSIGYNKRIENYYIIREYDGYINVSYDVYGRIQFHKNYYYPCSNKDIHEEFYNYLDFEKYMSAYHKKEIRKLKVEKLNNILFFDI